MPQPQRLLVKEPFGEYLFGDRITTPAAIKRALAEHPEYVLREADGEEAAQEQAALDAAKPKGDASKPPAPAKPPTTDKAPTPAPEVTNVTVNG